MWKNQHESKSAQDSLVFHANVISAHFIRVDALKLADYDSDINDFFEEEPLMNGNDADALQHMSDSSETDKDGHPITAYRKRIYLQDKSICS